MKAQVSLRMNLHSYHTKVESHVFDLLGPAQAWPFARLLPSREFEEKLAEMDGQLFEAERSTFFALISGSACLQTLSHSSLNRKLWPTIEKSPQETTKDICKRWVIIQSLSLTCASMDYANRVSVLARPNAYS